jgi:drug/metabolite transporter (DMT)-like permease
MTEQARAQKLASLAVVLSGALWGIYWIPLRWLDGAGVGGAWTSVLYSAIAALAALPWLLRAIKWRNWQTPLLSGLLLGTGFAFYTVALLMTDVVNAILLFYLTPVWSTIGGLLLHREKLTVPRLAAILCGFAGMVFILGFDKGLPIPRNGGDILALLAGMLWAAGSMVAFRRPTVAVALPVFCFGFGGLVTSLVILVIAALKGDALANTGNMVAHLPTITLVALVIFVPPNALVLWAMQRVDPGRVGILLMTELLVGSISAALFAGEAYGWMEAMGTALIVGAGAVEVFGRSKFLVQADRM